MHFFTLTTLLVAGSVTAFAGPLETRTDPKANEYSSTDCSGPINYPHHSPFLSSVNMDPSSHSVYLAGPNWHAYSLPGLNGNNNGCSGINLGVLPGECSDLDTALPGGRINCVATG